MAIHHNHQHVVLQAGTTLNDQFHFTLKCHLPFSDTLSNCHSMDEQTSKDDNSSAKSDTPASLSIPRFPVARSEETKFYQKVLLTVEKWFSLYGWPSGTNPICIPHSLRSLKKTIQFLHYRSVLDMLEHLSGRMIPRIPMCQTFSKDIHQRTTQLLQQNEEKDSEKYLDCNFFDFWSLSKRSWTDVLLQIYKVLVLSHDALLDGSHALTSTIYSLRELHLLSWLNMNYQKMRKIRCCHFDPRIPTSRWIVNFDLDFADGLVLGALIAAHCPYLIRSHFRRMYTTPCNSPQIFHNSIIVIQALILLGLSLNMKVKNKSQWLIELQLLNNCQSRGSRYLNFLLLVFYFIFIFSPN
uniref:Calponin-homology (CH) domain-containing protein n=1 Tax=Xiphophorus maculatus TaxID=8083 RepID=A0A3B5R0Y9_XIPMA